MTLTKVKTGRFLTQTSNVEIITKTVCSVMIRISFILLFSYLKQGYTFSLDLIFKVYVWSVN